MGQIEIKQLDDLVAAEVQPLLLASETEGFTFVRRLVEGYASGHNRFAQPGERLFGAFAAGEMVGVGGLNRDPYWVGETAVGRVRHLYVLPEWRRQGVGQQIMAAIMAHGRGHFQRLMLRTFNPLAATFYLSLGFQATPDAADATHQLTW
jgi:GNAT superfamily N-acetyltransferase